MIDVFIITQNEEANIGFCLRALAGWTNQIFVVDSGSTDRTQEIVEANGARFIHHDWPGFAKQKNWALENLPFKSKWILIVDADEEITPALREELLAIARRDPDTVPEEGFYINRRQWFLNRPLRFCYYPSWNLRFFKHGTARYEERRVHEHVLINGLTGNIRPPMKHWDRRGLTDYMAKHNNYSSLEAQALLDDHANSGMGLTPKFFGNSIQRRRWLKRKLYMWLPMPGVFRFLYMYVLRFGMLDGMGGFRFCLFIASYEMMVKLKLTELKRQRLDAGTVNDMALQEPRTIPTVDAPSDQDTLHIAVPRGLGPQSGPDALRAEVAEASVPTLSRTTATDGGYSVVILTMDETINIVACIESCKDCDDIHVLDSGSTDGTREMAEALGAQVHVHKFESFGAQRNWAIDNIPVKHDWILHLDADERLTDELSNEMRGVLASNPKEAGFYIPSKLIFMGRWLKRAGGYPTYQVRFFHRERLRFMDYGHGQREETNGTIGRLSQPYLHDAFSKGLDDWLSKHNRYSRREAEQALTERNKPIGWSGLAGQGPVVRRRVLKRIAYRVPFRAAMRWWSIMLLQGGFLEGRAARNYATLVTTYERMTGVKIRWLEHAVRLSRESSATRQQAHEEKPAA